MLELRKYVPNGRVSTGLLAWRGGRLVWVVGQRKYWRSEGGQTAIPLIGIGGGQEAGETLTEAVRREAIEEASSRLTIYGARSTLWVNADTGVIERRDLAVDLAGEPAPLLIWQMHLALRNDDGSPREIDYINPVYDAELVDEPQPAAEAPGLIHIATERFLSLAGQPRSLSELLSEGALYVGEALPPESLMVLQGSALFIARHWSELQRGR